jgi:membrane protein DedA with SNARE-associated domain
LIAVEGHLAQIVAWIEPHALLLALALPPVIRAVGHLIPEELFMVAIGVLAARGGSATDAAVLLCAAGLSHLATDHVVYAAGRWLRPRLDRFPGIARRLTAVTARLEERPSAMAGFVPARVLPLGRAAWLAGCGVARVPWRRFLGWDVAALSAHVAVWCGLGWWLSGDLARLEATAASGKVFGAWLVAAVLSVITAVALIRRRHRWQPATARAARRVGESIRGLRPNQ